MCPTKLNMFMFRNDYQFQTYLLSRLCVINLWNDINDRTPSIDKIEISISVIILLINSKYPHEIPWRCINDDGLWKTCKLMRPLLKILETCLFKHAFRHALPLHVCPSFAGRGGVSAVLAFVESSLLLQVILGSIFHVAYKFLIRHKHVSIS